MQSIFSARIAFPLLLVLSGTLLMMNNLDVLPIGDLARMWPVALIAGGVEELYRWAAGEGKVTGESTRRHR